MPQQDRPTLWTFRRCPYAMRARMAVLGAGVEVALREIKLKDKPQAFLEASPTSTVPHLSLGDQGLDESLDIMLWALRQNDPTGLLDMPEAGFALIAENDGPFKTALDHTKYASRYPELYPEKERAKASDFILHLNSKLEENTYLMGANPTLADIAIFPFVRQFAHIDRAWFDSQPWPHVTRWLDRYLGSADFATAMQKFPVWEIGAPELLYGGRGK